MTIEKGTHLKSNPFTILNTVGKNMQIRQLKHEIKFIAYVNLLRNALKKGMEFLVLNASRSLNTIKNQSGM